MEFHLRAVQLIWLFCTLVNPYIVERMLVVLIKRDDDFGFNRFGCFWRISEESVGNPSILYAGPLFAMFDTLSSSDPMIKRVGESWFKTYLKSNVRIVMPLLSILGDSSIAMERGIVCVDEANEDGVPVLVNFVRTTFNSGQVLYAFETLVALVGIGGGMLKSLWTCLIDFPVPWMASDYLVESVQISYSQLLVFLCLRFDYLGLCKGSSSSMFLETRMCWNCRIVIRSECILLLVMIGFVEILC